MKILSQRIERTEVLRFQLFSVITKENFDIVNNGVLCKGNFAVGDTLTVDQCVDIDYFGNTAKVLDTIVRLCEFGGKITKANMSELKHGQSILVDVVRSMDKVIAFAEEEKDG